MPEMRSCMRQTHQANDGGVLFEGHKGVRRLESGTCHGSMLGDIALTVVPVTSAINFHVEN